MAQEGDIREEHQRVTQECTPESPLFRPREDSESYQRSFREHDRGIFPNKGFPKFPWNPCFCCWQPPSVRCLLMPPSVLHITFLSLSATLSSLCHKSTHTSAQLHTSAQVQIHTSVHVISPLSATTSATVHFLSPKCCKGSNLLVANALSLKLQQDYCCIIRGAFTK